MVVQTQQASFTQEARGMQERKQVEAHVPGTHVVGSMRNRGGDG